MDWTLTEVRNEDDVDLEFITSSGTIPKFDVTDPTSGYVDYA